MEVCNDLSQYKTVKKGIRWDRIIFYILILAYPIVQFTIFYILVNLQGFALSFQRYDLDAGGYVWAGFFQFEQVYKTLALTNQIGNMLKNSALSFFAGIIVSTPLSLFVSYYLFRKMFATGFLRILFFLPGVISSMVISILFRILVGIALPSAIPGFENPLGNVNTQFWTVWAYSHWLGFGGSYLIYVGTMNDISVSVLESARIDGANNFREFISIVFPLFYPTWMQFFVLGLPGILTSDPGLFQFFELKADPRIQTFGYYIFKTTKSAGQAQFPIVSALGMCLTLVTLPIVLGSRYLMTKYGPSKD